MSPKSSHILALSCIVLAALCSADVNTLARSNQRYTVPRYNIQRLQRVEAAPTPYPAAGYRPDRTFALPPTNDAVASQPQDASNQQGPAAEAAVIRPNLIYGAPAAAPARLRQPAPAPAPARQQLQPQPQAFFPATQLQYGTPSAEPTPAQAARQVNAKPARLTATREDQEDIDVSTTSVDIDAAGGSRAAATPTANQNPGAVFAAQAPGGTIAYYPAGAINFVQPFAFQPAAGKAYAPTAARLIAAPVAQPLAQPQLFASPFPQQQQYAFAAPYQFSAW